MYKYLEDKVLVELRGFLSSYKYGFDTKKYWCKLTEIVDDMNEIRGVIKDMKRMVEERDVSLKKVKELESSIDALQEKRVNLTRQMLSRLGALKNEAN